KENAEPEPALAAYESSLRVDPAQPQVRYEMAQTLATLGRHADAERHLEACHGGIPEADRLDMLAGCAEARGDPARQPVLVDAGLAAAPDHPGLNSRRARIDRDDGRIAEAVGRLDRALAVNPYHTEWLYQRALCLHTLGRSDEAARDLARFQRLGRGMA